MILWCCGCDKCVEPALTNGEDMYPHRKDLFALPFWKCTSCNNFVGCHHKTRDRTRPLGCIPTKELRNARKHIHALLDPLWRNGGIGRREVYRIIGNSLGYEYHTANVRTIEEARGVYRVVKRIKRTLLTTRSN